MIHLVLQWIN